MTANNGHCPPHWYILPSPKGPTSEGVCKKCGEHKTFANSYKEWHGYQKDGASKLPPTVLRRL